MKTARRYARELAMKGIFQWQFNHDLTAVNLLKDLQDDAQYAKTDSSLLYNLLDGVLEEEGNLYKQIVSYYNCSESEVKPVERSILLIGTYELLHHTQTPTRVILNEAIEMAKTFGGTDGYKFINGVLDKLALAIRGECSAKTTLPVS